MCMACASCSPGRRNRRARLQAAAELSLLHRVDDGTPEPWDGPRLRYELRRMLERAALTPHELLDAWDLSADGLLTRREFLHSFKRLVGHEPLWYAKVRVCHVRTCTPCMYTHVHPADPCMLSSATSRSGTPRCAPR